MRSPRIVSGTRDFQISWESWSPKSTGLPVKLAKIGVPEAGQVVQVQEKRAND